MNLLVRIGIGLVVLVALALGVAVFAIDSLAETAIEKGGTYALGVQTELGSADVGLTSGKFALDGLRVANPPGFTSPAFFAIGHGEMALELSSLRSDQIEAPLLLLENVEVAVERKDGKTNYKEILAHLERFESGKDKEEKPSEPGKRFMIREVVLRNVVAHVDVLPLGGSLTKTTVTIPEIRLQDVGSGEGGKSIAEIVAVLVKAVLEATVNAGAGVIPGELLKDLGASLESLGDVGVELGKGVTSSVEKLGRELGKGADDVIKGLDGLLKKKP